MSTILIRRGTKAQLGAITLASGELGFTTDTKEVYAGDGVSNNLIGAVILGLLSSRPSHGNAGRLYYATDNGNTYLDTGSAWTQVGISALGDLTGTLDDITDGTTYGKVKNTEITDGNVTRVNDGTNIVTAEQAKTHIDDADKHRLINDSGTAATDLWSAYKITNSIDSKLQGISWQEPVINSIDLTTAEPVSPTEGDRYLSIVSGNTSTTAQAVSADDIVEWNGTSWDVYVPQDGWAFWNQTEDKQYTYNGTAWISFGSTTTHNSTSGLQGGTTNEYYHLTATQHVDLTDGTDSALHYHSADRNRANHTGTQTASTISDFAEVAQDAIGAALTNSTSISFTYDDAGNTITAVVTTVDGGSFS